MPSNTPLLTVITRNQSKPCSVAGCYSPRTRISSFCKKHVRTRHLWGHPLGHRITPRAYEVESLAVSAFIDTHRDHPAIVAALKWLDDWMIRAWNGDSSVAAYREFQRLHERSVSAVSVLRAAAALWVYASHFPNRLPDDVRLTYAMSLAVLALIPRERRPSPSKQGSVSYVAKFPASARRGIGERIRNNLGALMVNITDALNHIEAQQRSQREALRVPFTTNNTRTEQQA